MLFAVHELTKIINTMGSSVGKTEINKTKQEIVARSGELAAHSENMRNEAGALNESIVFYKQAEQ